MFVGVIAPGLSASEVQGGKGVRLPICQGFFSVVLQRAVGGGRINRLCFICNMSVFLATSPAY